ncbi:MAG: glycosyltransferase family 9 protein [Candidatus Omnitrophota bacterium]
MLELKSILILRFDHIGDVLLLTSMLKALRQNCSRAKITVALGSWSKMALDENPDVDEIIVFDHPRFNREKRPSFFNGLVASLRFLAIIRRHRFDAIIDPRSNLCTLLFVYLGGAKYRIGFDHGGRGFYLTTKAKENPKIHQIDRNLYLLEMMGFPRAKERKPTFFISHEDVQWARGLFLYHDMNNALVVHPSAPWPPRRWPVGRFAEIIGWYIENFKSHVVLIGAQEDMAISRQTKQMVSKDLQDHVVDMTGKTTLKQTAAVIKLSRIYLGVDSAPMHLAVAVGTPVIALMGPGEYPRFAPYGENNVTIRTRMKCSPCHQDRDYKSMRCFHGSSACMKQIETQEVKSQIAKILHSNSVRF